MGIGDQNLKRENKINKLLKYKNNPKSIIENNIEKEKENNDGKLDNNIHLRNSSKLLRENKVNNNNLINVNINKNIYDNDINNKECFFNMLFDESNLDCYCNYDNNFNNIKSFVKKIKFNQVIVNCGIFSLKIIINI